MALSESLKVLITGEGGQLVSEFGKVGNAAKKAYGDVGKGASEASTHTSGFDRVAGAVNGRLQKMGIDANVTGGALKAGLGAGVAAAGALVAKFAQDGINSFLQLTAQARSVQRVTGATAESASGLAFAFRKVGIDTDSAAPALARFGKNVELNQTAFDKYGITIAKTKDGATDLIGTFENAAESISKMQDPAERDAAALELFGKQGATMLPILLKGKQGIQEMFGEADKHHELFNQRDLDNGKKLTLATRELSEAFKGLEVSAAKGLAPLLSSAAQGGTQVLDFLNDATDSVGGLGSALKHIVGTTVPVVGGLVELGGGSENAAEKLDKLEQKARGNITTANQLQERLHGEADAAEEAAKKHEEQAKAIDDVINASLAAIDSSLGLERATLSEADAVASYNQALAANTAAGGQNAEAAHALTEASLSAKEAVVNEAEAAVRLATDQAKARGETVSAAQQAQIFKDKLLELASHIGGPLHDQLINMANSINSLPASKEIVINLDASGFQAQINYVKQQLTNIPGYVVSPDRSFGTGSAKFRAEGGIVTGPELAIIGEAGPELVLPLSKPARAAQLLAQANLIKPFATPAVAAAGSSGGSGGTTVVVNVGGSVTSEYNLAATIRKMLYDDRRRNGSVVLS